MRNKLAQTLSYVFILTYESTWSSFFNDFLSLLSTAQGGPVSNAKAVDIYLRVLNNIHVEIGDTLILRDADTIKRNNVLKDLIRDRDISKLTDSWQQILVYYSQQQNSSSANQRSISEIIDNCLKVIGGWVLWVDITLIVNPSYLNSIFSFFQSPDHRLSTCDTILEIISKKMKPADKLDLIKLLDLGNISASSDDPEFEERVAKLCNAVAIEIIHILDGSTSASSKVPVTQDIFESAEAFLVNFFPKIIYFLSNEFDDTSCQVLPCISEYLGFVRMQSKQAKDQYDTSQLKRHRETGTFLDFPPDSQFIPATRMEILSTLLSQVIRKMKYDPDSDWTGGEDESESEFLDIRAKLKVIQDQIASIDMDLYTDGIASVVTSSLSNPSSWQDAELGLYELSAFSESLKNGAISVIKGIESRPSKVLYELFFKMIESNIVVMNHPSIQLHYMELVNRHCMFFSSSNMEALGKVFEAFVSPLGIHNGNTRVQVRSWYLFYRFVKSVRSLLRPDIIETIYTSVQPLLQIKAELPEKDEDEEEISGEKAAGAGTFDSQLYLFELCGLLLSNHRVSSATTNTSDVNSNGGNKNKSLMNSSNNDPNNDKNNNNTNNTHSQTLLSPQIQLQLMQGLLQPIYRDVEAILQNGSLDQLASLQVHHDLMAIGTFSRGFNDISTNVSSNSDSIANAVNMDPQIANEFNIATQVVITSLERMGRAEVIRDAARFSISRIIPVLGAKILPDVTRLISCLLESSKLHEWVDFWGFLGQLAHNFKREAGIYDMFDTLMTPLFAKATDVLKQAESEASGGSTDAIILKRSLRKGFLALLYNLLNNGLGALLFSKNNISIYEPILELLLVYSADVQADSDSAKVAILILNKMLLVWGNGTVKEDQYQAGASVPGFEQFTLQHISRITWEIPTKPNFNPRDAQMRGILGDLATVQQAIQNVYKDMYVQFLAEQYLPSIGLPQEYINEYLNKLSNANPKQFKSFYIQLITSLVSKN